MELRTKIFYLTITGAGLFGLFFFALIKGYLNPWLASIILPVTAICTLINLIALIKN